MGARSGAEYLAGLGNKREIWLDGEQVADVTTDPRLAGAAHAIAELYDLQLRPDLIETMTYESPTTGDPVGLSFIEPRSADDLARRRRMVKTWMDHTSGMFGRSADFMNIMVTGLALDADSFQRPDRPYGAYLRDYYHHIRERDLVLTHTLVTPQYDRSRPVEEQDTTVAAHAVDETDEGWVIRGARMVSTLCAHADEMLVAPSSYLANSPDAAKYAFCFALPIDAPGMRFICRPSLIPQGAASAMDHPLSHRLDEIDGMVIFDDVLVPWERTFVYRDVSMCNGLFNRTGAMAHVMHQFSTKNLAKAEFMMGLAMRVAESTNVDQFLHVQNMLSEMIVFTEQVRAALVASEAEAQPGPGGAYQPASMPLWTVRQTFPQQFQRMCEIIQIIGAGGLVAVPSYAELAGPHAGDVERYLQAANAGSRERIRLFRLAWDAAVSGFSGRQQLYERYYSGDPVRLAAALFELYDSDPHKDRIDRLLDDLEGRQAPPGTGRAFT
ncbi:MAG: 4-hydroxyphenylacetate 3-monooxygenase, oxygenase component [Acidimicrobiia bacterium]|nr:4-hydroxyphenylacetate 3-monooxygenase, oxygenase component [Acidimicrobiia bacterium]